MQFSFEQVIELPRSLVFSFYEDPEHLLLLHGERLHAQRSALRMIRHDGHLRVGSTIWFEINIAGVLPVVMGFEHTIYDPPRLFWRAIDSWAVQPIYAYS